MQYLKRSILYQNTQTDRKYGRLFQQISHITKLTKHVIVVNLKHLSLSFKFEFQFISIRVLNHKTIFDIFKKQLNCNHMQTNKLVIGLGFRRNFIF